MKPAELSRQLRTGQGPFLARRRAIVGLSLTTIGAMGLLTLYQMGIIKHVPELPLPLLDADKVDASPEAYARLATPDAALGLAGFGVTLVLAAMGGPDRAARQPLIPLAMAAKIGFDVAVAAKLTVEQMTKHRAFCSWCLLAASATFAQAPLALPEARAAWRQLTAGRATSPRSPLARARQALTRRS